MLYITAEVIEYSIISSYFPLILELKFNIYD